MGGWYPCCVRAVEWSGIRREAPIFTNVYVRPHSRKVEHMSMCSEKLGAGLVSHQPGPYEVRTRSVRGCIEAS
jgi:hypothetical protein